MGTTDPPGVRALTWALDWTLQPEPDRAVLPQRFDPAFLHSVHVDRLMAARTRWQQAITGYRLVSIAAAASPDRAIADFETPSGAMWRAGCSVTATEPQRIASLWMAPAPALSPATTTLRTARLLLRPVESDDLEPFCAMSADPEVMRWVGHGAPENRDRAEQTFEWLRSHWERHGYGNWTIVDAASGAFVGRGGLNVLGDDVEVAYVLDKPWWGRGLATEVAREAVAWGFEELGLERIIGITYPDNEASKRVLMKAGLQPAGKAEYAGMSFDTFATQR